MGGAHPKNTDQIINIGTIGPQVRKTLVRPLEGPNAAPEKN